MVNGPLIGPSAESEFRRRKSAQDVIRRMRHQKQSSTN